jgi:hypothetical protein
MTLRWKIADSSLVTFLCDSSTLEDAGDRLLRNVGTHTRATHRNKQDMKHQTQGFGPQTFYQPYRERRWNYNIYRVLFVSQSVSSLDR